MRDLRRLQRPFGQPVGCRFHVFVVSFLIKCCLCVAMVHRHSPAKLAERRAEAARRGFLQPRVEGKSHMLVDTVLKPRLVMMQKGLSIVRGLECEHGLHRRSPMALVRAVEDRAGRPLRSIVLSAATTVRSQLPASVRQLMSCMTLTFRRWLRVHPRLGGCCPR